MSDNRVWGWVHEGKFCPLPRWPGYDHEPPFDVELPSGEVRRVIWQEDAPAATLDDNDRRTPGETVGGEPSRS